MNDTHVLDALAAWDPDERDLDDVVALHLDACSTCRAAFDHRFAVAPEVANRSRRGTAIARGLCPPIAARRELVLGGLAAGAALVALARWGIADQDAAGGLPFEDAEAAWTAFEDANRTLDGRAALGAVGAYLAMDPAGPHAKMATTAQSRLALVGVVPPVADARWISGAAPPGDSWMAVLWEVWCKYCVPALRRVRGLGLSLPVVAWTTESRGATDDDVRSQLTGLDVPVAVLGAAASEALHTGVWPTAVLVCGGSVRWAGGPESVTPEAVTAACALGTFSP